MAEEQLVFDFVLEEQSPQPETAPMPRQGNAPLVRIGTRRVVTAAPAANAAAELRRPRRPRGVDRSRPIQQKYDAVVDMMLAKYRLHVRCWRNSLSGLATLRQFRDGRLEHWIESPYPTTPLRMAIFLHEVGHHAIGLGVHRPRCVEELRAWEWSIGTMRALGLRTDGTVMQRFRRTMRYEVWRSMKRGMRRVPDDVASFVPPFAVVGVAAHRDSAAGAVSGAA